MSFATTLITRYLLVCLFFPFSALDKIVNFKGATGQAKELVGNDTLAALLIVGGLTIEVLMPIAILTGKADRLAALIMAGYCCMTAILWKRFWESGDFWHRGVSKGRDLFWDFLKNFSLAGGFLMLAVGLHEGELAGFIKDPLASSRPYSTHPNAVKRGARLIGSAQEP